MTGLALPGWRRPFAGVVSVSLPASFKPYLPALLGAVALTVAVLILPNQTLVADAIKQATARVQSVAAPTQPVAADPKQRLAALAQLFAADKPMTLSEVQDLLAGSVSTASTQELLGMAARLDRAGQPSTSSRTAYEILASGRPAVARQFLEGRPDRNLPELWRLGFELRRSSGDTAGAQTLLIAAVNKPGTAPEKDIVEGAHELNRPDLILVAAERGAVSRLDRKTSLDLAQRAVAASHFDQIARIDRAGTPEWRLDDPWLAMNLALREGNTQEALRYADMLPSGRDQARKAIILASGDKAAMRALFLDEARLRPSDHSAIAQQMLEAGLRPDSVALLRDDAAALPPTDPSAQRLLYLMGPRPDAANLAWLRARANADPAWLRIYAERERPAVALAYVEGRRDQSTEMLILRLQLAAAARDRAATNRAMTKLLDGRPLTAAQVTAATAQMPPGAPKSLTLGLAKARVAAGAALPNDRLDLAWDAFDRGDFASAASHLDQQLKTTPNDRRALLLMADVVEKQQGPKSARPWLERALAQSPPNSLARLELLERLRRYDDALELVEKLRAQSPNDRKLEIVHARLLIVTGHPGKAQRMLQP